MTGTDPAPRSQRWVTALAVAALVLAAGCFFSTALSTAWARIAALQTIEPYAFAVHEQLLYNFSQGGEFFQTIHTGYDDAWTWSGHRAATLPLVGLLYGLWPGPVQLAGILAALVTLGVVPAAMLGRSALKHPAGLALGGLLYLACPAVMALALQDYQDLVLALPCLMVTLWAMRARRFWWVILGALVGCLPREECVPAVLAAAVITMDLTWDRPWRRWLRNLGTSAAVVLVYSLALALLFPLSSGEHDMPLAASLGSFVDPEQQIRLFGLQFFNSFYALMWAPVGLVGLLAPLAVLPGLGLMLMHMTVPWGHGVDRSWSGHAHHLAPVLPFFVAASILGAARLLRWCRHPRLGRAGSLLPWIAVAALLAYGAWWDLTWSRAYNLVLSPLPARPALWHPAWALVEQLPQDAVPVVPLEVSLAVSARDRSYTFGESLADKAPELGLAAGSHLIVHADNSPVRRWGMAMPGAAVVASSEPFLLIGWDQGAEDPTWAAGGVSHSERIPSWPYKLGAVGGVPGLAPPAPPTPELPVKPVER